MPHLMRNNSDHDEQRPENEDNATCLFRALLCGVTKNARF